MANWTTVNYEDVKDKGRGRAAASSAITSTDKFRKFVTELKATRLDQTDICNVSDPSKYIAPNGCHYSSKDIDMTMLENDGISEQTAISILASTSRYSTLPSKADNIDYSDKSLIEWAVSKGYNVSDEYKKAVGISVDESKRSDGSRSPDNKSIEQAKSQKVSQPTDAVQQVAPGSREYGQAGVKGEQLKKDDYIPWLCKLFNELCRADSTKPQIPTSVAVSMALGLSGIDTSNIGKYNFWKLPYDKSISGLGNEDNMCSFSTEADGASGCLAFAHKHADAITGLADNMWDTTEDVKQKVTKALIYKIDPDGATSAISSAEGCVSKYNLREWDTNKTEAEGGHADTKRDTDSQGSKNIQNAINKVVEQINHNQGVGFQFIPRGKDYTEVIKLPVNKTPCEPIYPDFIEVGDTVPEWVFSQSYAQIREEIKNSGNFTSLTESANYEKQKQIEAIEKELNKFKEDQFAKWIQSQGLKYSTEDEKKEAKDKYSEAYKTDNEHFIDGVYIADEADKGIYNSLVTKRNNLTGDLGNNVDNSIKLSGDKENKAKNDKANEVQ